MAAARFSEEAQIQAADTPAARMESAKTCCSEARCPSADLDWSAGPELQAAAAAVPKRKARGYMGRCGFQTKHERRSWELARKPRRSEAEIPCDRDSQTSRGRNPSHIEFHTAKSDAT